MRQQGFSLMELMIVVVIIGILGAVAMPMYQNYTRRARYAEIVHAAAPYKLAVSECYQLYGDVNHCNGGSNGVPANISSGSNNTLVDSLTVASGVITITPESRDGFTASDTYVLTPHVSTQHITWTVSGGAVSAGYVK